MAGVDDAWGGCGWVMPSMIATTVQETITSKMINTITIHRCLRRAVIPLPNVRSTPLPRATDTADYWARLIVPATCVHPWRGGYSCRDGSIDLRGSRLSPRAVFARHGFRTVWHVGCVYGDRAGREWARGSMRPSVERS